MSYNVFSFYVDLDFSNVPDEIKLRENLNWRHYLKCQEETLKMTNPESKFIVITDQHTELDHEHIFRFDVPPPQSLMKSIIVGQYQAIKSKYFDRPSILMGADQLFCGPLSLLFLEDFDISILTLNADKLKIIYVNNSVICVNPKKSEKVESFFEKRIECFNQTEGSDKEWGIDQRSYEILLSESDLTNRFTKYDLDFIFHRYNEGPVHNACGKKEVNPKFNIKKDVCILDFKGLKRKKFFDFFYRGIKDTYK